MYLSRGIVMRSLSDKSLSEDERSISHLTSTTIGRNGIFESLKTYVTIALFGVVLSNFWKEIKISGLSE